MAASITVVALAVGITFIVTCVLGTIVGIFIWCITVKCKPTHCSKSMPKTSKQESEPEPIYETIMDFKDNVAYGIVQSPTSAWLLVQCVIGCCFAVWPWVPHLYLLSLSESLYMFSFSHSNTFLYIITLSSLWIHDGHSLPSLALSIIIASNKGDLTWILPCECATDTCNTPVRQCS